jgi:hypothetical protein
MVAWYFIRLTGASMEELLSSEKSANKIERILILLKNLLVRTLLKKKMKLKSQFQLTKFS